MGQVSFPQGQGRPSSDPVATSENNEWKGNLEKEDRYESNGGKTPHNHVLEGFRADANHGLGNNRHDGGFHAEKDRCNPSDLAVGGIDPTQTPEEKHRGQNKQSSRNNAAPDLVQQPTDVDRELVGLGPGEQHAKIQRMEESRLTDPFFLLHEFPMQQRNLSRRP